MFSEQFNAATRILTLFFSVCGAMLLRFSAERYAKKQEKRKKKDTEKTG